MLNSVIALASATEILPFNERASQAGIVSLQGMLTIFLVLAILWAAIEIMHRVIVGKESEPEAAKTEQTAASAPAVSSEAAAVAPVQAASEDDGALVAAITAAITAARAEEGCTGGFRVVSFKRSAGARKR